MKVAVPLRMSRLGPQPKSVAAPKRETPANPEVLQKANEIIKDRSADCKPRKVTGLLMKLIFKFYATTFDYRFLLRYLKNPM